MKGTRLVVVGLLLGLILGGIVAWSGSALGLTLADGLAPIGALWVNAIRMTVIPLVISLLVTGVASASDLRDVGRLGGRTIVAFIGLGTINAVAMGLLTLQVVKMLPPHTGGTTALPPGAAQAATDHAQGANHVPTVGEWITSLLPTNPFRAASEGAMVPLILFVVLFALAVAKSPAESRSTLVGFFRALSEAMLTLVRWVIGLAPVGVFVLMFSLTARTGIGVAGSLGGYILAYSVACLVFVLLMYPIVSVLGRVAMGRFAKATLPAQLIAFSSSSSIATLPALTEGAEGELALPKNVTRFVLPLAVSTFKYAGPVSWMVGSTFIAWFYGIPFGLSQVAVVAFAAVVLGFATPGVPRGAFLMLTPLFQVIGLPAAGIGILIAVDAIPDLFATVLNVTGDMGVTAIVARFSGERESV